MKTQLKSYVAIYQVSDRWILIIIANSHLTRAFTATRLIDVLDAVSTLQLHVDNGDELPINQYTKAV